MSAIYPFLQPGEPVRPRDHAEAAAEAIRALNHATLRHGEPAGYEWPSDVDAVIGQLQALIAYLPQALEQAQSWLLDQQAAGRVGHDTSDRKPAFAVAVVVARLNEAQFGCQDLANALNEARRESSHLTGVLDDEPGQAQGAGEGGGD